MSNRSISAIAAVLVILFALVRSAVVFAQDDVEEVVVTATRIESPLSRVGSSVTVITGEELKKTGEVFVGDALRYVPGLSVKKSGGYGGSTGIFVRGMDSSHVLVLIDGVEVNDPSSVNRAFDFADLTVDNVERIEIIRGPQSTLYGSDAVSGVINIITRKGEGPSRFELETEYGSDETRRSYASFSAGSDRYDFSVSISKLDTGGISMADERDGNDERDPYKSSTATFRGGIRVADWLYLSASGRYQESEVNLDNFNYSTFRFEDDLYYTQDTDLASLRLEARVDCAGGKVENIFGFSGSTTDRSMNDEPDPVNSSQFQADYHGRFRKFDYQGNFFLSDSITLTGGFEAQEEMFTSSYDSEKAARVEGYYGQVQLEAGRFSGTVGGRIDHHSRFGSEFSYRVQAVYGFENTGTLFRVSYGTGFKAPSLFQLFSSFGDPDLSPEKSRGFDFGVEQEFAGGKVRGGLTWFWNEQKNLIDFNSVTWKYYNVNRARTKGLEAQLNVLPLDWLEVRGTYTYNDARKNPGGGFLLGVPRNSGSLSVLCDIGEKGEKGSVAVTASFKGKIRDYPDVVVPGYTVVNVSASYRVKEGVTLFGRVENLLNRDYQEVAGYGTPGISGFGGVRLAL